jgi:hypothetical protein
MEKATDDTDFTDGDNMKMRLGRYAWKRPQMTQIAQMGK